MAHTRALLLYFIRLILVTSIGTSTCYIPAPANPGDVNSINNGQHVTNGTYYNTPGEKTTFTNTSGTGIYIKAGTTITAREVSNSADPSGSLTGNGGWVNILAPHQVVRIDGNIDANALLKNGVYLGNGGKVTVTANYLYQNGQIYASGLHGGLVQFNVGSLTMGPAATVIAQGGGVVKIGNSHSHGVFDIQQGAIIDTAGKVIGKYDANLITIQGGLINLDGILMANGVRNTTTGGADSNGGAITLIATGHSKPLNDSLLNNSNFMSGLKTSLEARDTSLRINNYNGWIRVGHSAVIQANGVDGTTGNNSSGGNGGSIKLYAHCGIQNSGTIQSNGGNGGDSPTVFGTLSVIGSDAHFEENAVAKDGANGGHGGYTYFQYGTTFQNLGTISSTGGYGGHGGNAIATNPVAQKSWAYAGDGGDGGYGGYIDFTGGATPALSGGAINQNAGAGGTAGVAISQTLGQAFNGHIGHVKDIGKFDYFNEKFCTNGCDGQNGSNSIAPAITVSNRLLDSNPENPNFNGLFQHSRPIFSQPINNITPPFILALSQKRMFLARTYSSVTQEILTLAMIEYTRLRTIGRTVAVATQEAKNLLFKAGVDKDVAQSLLEQIQTGRLRADNIISSLLNEIAGSSNNRGIR